MGRLLFICQGHFYNLLIPSGPGGAQISNFASTTYQDKRNEAYCDERLSLGEFP